jgi:hypothetical protein
VRLGFGKELLAAQFAQVVGALAGAVVVGGLSGHRSDLGGELGDGEALRGDRQRECRGERGANPGEVHVDTADPGCGDVRGCGELVEDAVGQKPRSTQSSMLVNRSTMPVSWVVIWGNLCSLRPQPSCLVLCAIASKRSTRSPLVYAFSQRQQAKVDLVVLLDLRVREIGRRRGARTGPFPPPLSRTRYVEFHVTGCWVPRRASQPRYRTRSALARPAAKPDRESETFRTPHPGKLLLGYP